MSKVPPEVMARIEKEIEAMMDDCGEDFAGVSITLGKVSVEEERREPDFRACEIAPGLTMIGNASTDKVAVILEDHLVDSLPDFLPEPQSGNKSVWTGAEEAALIMTVFAQAVLGNAVKSEDFNEVLLTHRMLKSARNLAEDHYPDVCKMLS